ncbi:MAG: hypothetical protein LBV57_02365 [Candidatus Symbiothrix sp.]|jgi:hypothetical protein|nr:hypothetical protein [Candidatus Symbiothrix sp.]
MKKKLITAAISLFVLGSLTVDASGAHTSKVTFKERTEQWLKNPQTEYQINSEKEYATQNGAQRISSPTMDPALPLSDSLLTFIVLSGGYFVWLLRKKEKSIC